MNATRFGIAANPQNRRRTAGALTLFLGLYTAWLLWGANEPWPRLIIGSVTLIFTAGLLLTISLWVQQQNPQKALRWLQIGFGFLLVSDIVRPIVQRVSPAISVGAISFEFFSIAAALPLWLGLCQLPRARRRRTGRAVLIIDLALVTTGFAATLWVVVLQPVMTALQASGSLPAGLNPLIDLFSLLLLLVLFLLSDPARLSGSWGWFAFAFICYAFSDIAYASLIASAGYQSGSPLDIGWAVGDLAMAVGLLIQPQSETTAESTISFWRRLATSFQSLLPLVLVLVLGWYTLLTWQLTGALSQVGLWATVALALGMVARQGILTGEMELQKYASLVTSIAEPAFVCDRRGRLQLVNPALLIAAGYDAENDLLAAPLQHLLHPAHQTSTLLAHGLRGGWSGEVYLRRKDSRLMPIFLSLRPLQPSGNERLVLAGTAHDLSLQKQQQADLQTAYEQIAADRTELEMLNQRLGLLVDEKTADLTRALAQLEEQNRALQELDRLKSEFVTLVSHELRAPLTNINSGIELLLARSEPLPDRARGNLSLVQSEIRRLTRFVETILDLSALDAGKLPLYPAPLLLSAALAPLRAQFESHPAAGRLCWEIPEQLPPVLADEQALQSVLFHLIDNAFKYAARGTITISAAGDDEQVCIRVSDEGPGIEPEALPHLFDRFYRANPADAQAVYGHGLGLHIVQRLTEAMGGSVNAANRPGGGAEFQVQLKNG